MTKMTTKVKTQKSEKAWFFLGALAVFFMGVPYLVLGKDSVFVYHDQLDGEVIAYLLQARHLWDGSGVLPEFMNGAAKTALTMPAPACVLLYRWLPAELALACMQVAGSFAGYLGMFCLLGWAGETSVTLRRRKGLVGFIAMLTGCMYAYLPFLPVYGLSQYGLPLLMYCVLRLGEKDRPKNFRILCYFYVLLFGCNSSLVLSGFAVLGIWAVWEIVTLVDKRKQFSAGQAAAWGILLLTYIVENGSLLLQLSGGQGEEISHKSEYLLSPVDFFSQLKTNLLQGGQHSVDYHGLILVVLLMTTVVLFFLNRATKKDIADKKNVPEGGEKRLWKAVGLSLAVIAGFAAVAALWDSSIGIAIRSSLGALKGFQANRVLWLSPCLWYFILGCSLLLLTEQLPERDTGAEKTGNGRRNGVIPGIIVMAAMLLTVATAGKILLESNLKPNLQKLVNRNYAAMSFRDYYAVDVLDQVQEYLRENTGEEPQDYRVVSLGIDPAAALYHGFYCLDGYSNNYSLEYKHRFREIIAPELDKSEYLEDSFDHWGNRCYLFSAECPGYYTIEKGGFYFQDYTIDAESLRQLGGSYLLSAAYIDHSEDTGLELMRPEAFETENSYYRIYLYRVMDNE